MQSSVLIKELQLDLYTRFYYALVDSDNLLKALSDEDIKTMLKVVSTDTRKIRELKTFNKDIVSITLFNDGLKPYPLSIKEEMDKLMELLDKKFPKLDSKGKRIPSQLEAKGKELSKLVKETIVPLLNRKFPGNENEIESKVLLEYAKNVLGTDIKSVKKDIRAYEKKNNKLNEEQSIIDENQRGIARNQKEADTKEREKQTKERMAEWKKTIAREKSERPKSLKLMEDYMKWVNRESEDKSKSYTTMMNLINLVGSLDANDEKSILRLKKFLNNNTMSASDKTKIEEILSALEKEFKDLNVEQAISSKITPSALEAKADGLAVGKRSNYRFSKNNKTKKTSIRINYSDDYRTLRPQFFDKFEKIDLRNNFWFNNNTLKVIPEYWIKKAGYKKGIDSWEDESPEVKNKFIKKVVRILPDYPSPEPKLKADMATLFNDVWEDYSSSEEYSPEDFAYFTQGIRNALLSSNSSDSSVDFLHLKKFKDIILPRLIDAVKKGVIIDIKEDGTKERTFRLGPSFSRIMDRMDDKEERDSVIKDLVAVISGKSLSTKYKGRNKKELQTMEDEIVNMIKPEIKGKSIASYIISTFLELYKSSSVLTAVFKEESPEVSVEFLTPDKPSPSQIAPRNKPNNSQNLADARAVSFRSTLKPKEKVTPPKAGNKHAKFIDKETERLKKIKITQKDMQTQAFRFREKGKKVGDRMYDDIEIWRMLGFRKVTKTQSGRDMSGNRLTPKEISTYEKYSPLKDNQKETKKSLDNLLIVLRESDDVIIKEDVGIILESLNKTQRKKVKAILNIADPTEYFGHDFLKLADLVKVLKSLGVVKGDKKLRKKILNLEDENLKVVKLATRLRKDYENLYRDLREMIYPKSGE
jgi:hypothetical protein